MLIWDDLFEHYEPALHKIPTDIILCSCHNPRAEMAVVCPLCAVAPTPAESAKHILRFGVEYRSVRVPCGRHLIELRS